MFTASGKESAPHKQIPYPALKIRAKAKYKIDKDPREIQLHFVDKLIEVAK